MCPWRNKKHIDNNVLGEIRKISIFFVKNAASLKLYRASDFNIVIWAASSGKMPSDIAKCADSDHPAQEQSIMRAFAFYPVVFNHSVNGQ